MPDTWWAPPAGTTPVFVSLYTRPVTPFALQLSRPVAPAVGPNSVKTTVPPAGRRLPDTDEVIVAESCGYVNGPVAICVGIVRTVTFSDAGAPEHADAAMFKVFGESPA